MIKSKLWIQNSPHKPWCSQSPGNIYACDGDPCDCGKDEALKEIEQLENMMQQVTPAAMPNEKS